MTWVNYLMFGALLPVMFLGAALALYALYAVFIAWVLMFAICGSKWAQYYWRNL